MYAELIQHVAEQLGEVTSSENNAQTLINGDLNLEDSYGLTERGRSRPVPGQNQGQDREDKEVAA